MKRGPRTSQATSLSYATPTPDYLDIVDSDSGFQAPPDYANVSGPENATPTIPTPHYKNVNGPESGYGPGPEYSDVEPVEGIPLSHLNNAPSRRARWPP